jgi:hypothetical protein
MATTASSCVAIDWPSTIGYRVSRDGDRIEVAFTRPANIDQAGAAVAELLQIEAVNGDVARIYLTLAPGAAARFRPAALSLDIMRLMKQTAVAPGAALAGQDADRHRHTDDSRGAGAGAQTHGTGHDRRTASCTAACATGRHTARGRSASPAAVGRATSARAGVRAAESAVAAGGRADATGRGTVQD